MLYNTGTKHSRIWASLKLAQHYDDKQRAWRLMSCISPLTVSSKRSEDLQHLPHALVANTELIVVMIILCW